jgi:hypothetical protein
VRAHQLFGAAGQREIAHGERVLAARLGVAASVAESIELLDIAEL